MFRRDFFKGLFGGTAVLELPEVKQVEILRLEPDDVVLVTVEGRISYNQMVNMKAVIKQVLPEQRILIMDSGSSISVIKGAK